MPDTPETTARIARLMHFTRVDTCVALQREGHLADQVEGLAEALDTMGIRPPASFVDELRRRYPRIYATVEATPDTLDERDLLRRLHARALQAYAIELAGLADRIGRAEADPVGTYCADHDTDNLAIPLGVAAADYLETSREEYDALIGASYTPTHTAG